VKPFLTVCAIALLIRIVMLALLFPQLSPDVNLDDYRSLARSLSNGNGFVAPSPDGRILPNVARTPVYPVFLAGLMRFAGDQLGWFLTVQCFLGALTSGLTVLFARRWLPPAVAFGAGLLVALDPNSIIRCADLRTETLFTLLLLLGAIACSSESKWSWLLAGVAWGAATLCRPIAVWLWVPLVAIALVRRVRPACLGLFFCAYCVICGGWLARNMMLTGRPFVSTIALYNLLMYRAAAIEADQTGTTLAVVQQRWEREAGNLQWFDGGREFAKRWQHYRSTAVEVILAQPARAARQAVSGWGKLLFGPGVHSLDSSLSEPTPSGRWWPRLYSTALVLMLVLAVFGGLRMKKDAMLSAALGLYFILLSGGPEANSRFRTPITPMWATFVAASWKKRT